MNITGTFPRYKIEFEEGEHYPDGVVHLYLDKAKDFDPEWAEDPSEIISKVFHVEKKKVEKAFGMIYENDIPDMPDNSIYTDECVISNAYFNPEDGSVDYRWKPNGITDNIEEWRSKNCELLAEMESKDEFIR